MWTRRKDLRLLPTMRRPWPRPCAEVLGWVMTRIILTLFFYALLTPYGLG